MDKKALNNLDRAVNIEGSYKDKAKNYPDFKELWNNESFRKIASLNPINLYFFKTLISELNP